MIHNNALSIQLTLDGLSFCHTTPDGSSVTTFKSEEGKLLSSNAVSYIEEMAKEFDHIFIEINNNSVVVLPLHLYDKDISDSYLDIKVANRNSMAQITTESNGIVFIFGIERELFELINNNFRFFEYVHTLQRVVEIQKEYNCSGLFVDSGSVVVSLVLVADEKMLFCDSFSFVEVGDIAYYITKLLAQHKLDELPILYRGKHLQYISDIFPNVVAL